jgi:lipopolysaccharide transport system ATP-binding protein
MGDVAIRVSGLGKQYRIGASRRSFNTLRETMTDTVVSAARALRGNWARQSDETIWALNDVSFDVRRGEVLGIIGRNGAGKSTLLKILSRITEPTCGEVDVYGRVASLLEVGTGFHPELTGRDNIYLNGAVLGMRRRETQRKFDEIVDFAGVEKFIDTPVKHYSSGMYMRLAFAVAAHLEPEILLVDEVLAVGDAEFQKKCLGMMGEVAKGGRTVLFVSHNLAAIGNLCRVVLWIDSGHLRRSGQPTEIISHYLAQGTVFSGEIDLTQTVSRVWPGPVRILWASTKNTVGEISTQFEMGSTLVIETDVFSQVSTRRLAFSIDLKTSTGIPVLHIVDRDADFAVAELCGKKRLRISLPKLSLYPGIYLVSIWAGDPMGNGYDYANDCLSIEVRPGNLIKRSGLSWQQALCTFQSEWQVVDL